MNFNPHYNLEGRHAFLSPSKYSWINYSDEHLEEAFMKYHAKEVGTKLHQFAKQAIELGVKMPTDNWTVYMYINDCIDHDMTPEQPLYYSENAFGTADALGFDPTNMILRTFDLKTGSTKASMNQIYIYNALFCLEYKISPQEIQQFDDRIYQANTVTGVNADPNLISAIMDKIIIFDTKIEKLKRGGV